MALQDLWRYEGLTPAPWASPGWDPARRCRQTQYRQSDEDSPRGLPGLTHLPLRLAPFLSSLVSAAVGILRARNPGAGTGQALPCRSLRRPSHSCWVLDCRAPPPSLTSTRASRSSESSTRTPCARRTPGLGAAAPPSPVGPAALGPLPPSTRGPPRGVPTGSSKLHYQQSLAPLLRPRLLSKSRKRKRLPTCQPWPLAAGLLRGS